MSARPYMHLYISDYLGDTGHLTTEQHGAYLLILMGMWKAGGTLDNDPETLRSLAKVDAKRWADIARKVMPFFSVIDGRLTQKRLQKEAAKASAISDQKKVASQQGVIARALSKKGLHKPHGQPSGQPHGQPKHEPPGKPDDDHPVASPVNLSHKENITSKVEVLDPRAPSSESSVPQPLASLQRTLGARSLAAASEVASQPPNGRGTPYAVSPALVEATARLTHSRRA